MVWACHCIGACLTATLVDWTENGVWHTLVCWPRQLARYTGSLNEWHTSENGACQSMLGIRHNNTRQPNPGSQLETMQGSQVDCLTVCTVGLGLYPCNASKFANGNYNPQNSSIMVVWPAQRPWLAWLWWNVAMWQLLGLRKQGSSFSHLKHYLS